MKEKLKRLKHALFSSIAVRDSLSALCMAAALFSLLLSFSYWLYESPIIASYWFLLAAVAVKAAICK